MKHLAICMYSPSRFRIRNLLKHVCDIYSWCIFCLSDAINVYFHVAMFAVERLVPFLEKLCLLGLRLSLTSTGATSNGKMKHNDICMHIHTRFRIRKLPKHVCDIYSWCFFYMSDAYVFFTKLCLVSEGPCPSSSLCVFWGYVFGILFLHWGLRLTHWLLLTYWLRLT